MSARAGMFGARADGSQLALGRRARVAFDWTTRPPLSVIPAQAGIHCLRVPECSEQCRWAPAFAGATAGAALTGLDGRYPSSFQRKLESIAYACRKGRSNCRWAPALARATVEGCIGWDYAATIARHPRARWNPLSVRAGTCGASADR
ncbi:MAG: hypothetical protein JNN09_09495, partial [Alphaproteobacteria bacterium]|nr:hypothetical protein [Alphaproteobacteria bacterium]